MKKDGATSSRLGISQASRPKTHADIARVIDGRASSVGMAMAALYYRPIKGFLERPK